MDKDMKQKRNTVQKGIVFDVFREMHNHPSAGMVYEAVHEKYPEISKATVYRLLAEAAEEGEVLRLKLVEADDRYDITLGRHYHIVCRECGSVADVDATLDEGRVLMNARGYENFLVEDVHMEFKGICERCRQNVENQN
jgi:Fe2+ or Zn2+ uptake regulation protein